MRISQVRINLLQSVFCMLQTKCSEHKFFYHFTNFNALENILKNNKIWYFEISKQKDNEEVSFSGNLIYEYFLRKLQKIAAEHPSKLINRIISSLKSHKEDFIQIYWDSTCIFCLSKFESNYMWENYTDENDGLCIVFDFSKKCLFSDINKYSFDVHYLSENINNVTEDNVFFQSIINEFCFNLIKCLKDEDELIEICNIENYILGCLFQLSVFFKSEKYKSENEVRCFYTLALPEDEKCIKLYDNRRYIEQPNNDLQGIKCIMQKHNDISRNLDLPITRIKIKKSKNYKERANQIDRLLKENNFSHVDVAVE